MQNISSDLKLAITAAEKSGEVIREGYGNVQKIDVKEGKGIVTETDKNSEKAILNVLQKGSKYSVLTEESGKVEGDNNFQWVIDPLDGTTNFSKGIPLFAISIALLKGNSVELGVILNPVTNELFFAEKDKGAYLNNKHIQVSKNSSLSGSLIFLNHGYAQETVDRATKVLNELNKYCFFRRFGTTALELCYVARGFTEGFICSGDELWDYAAGILIVQEAGGRITDWKGKAWDNSNNFICASNSFVHDELIRNINSLQNI